MKHYKIGYKGNFNLLLEKLENIAVNAGLCERSQRPSTEPVRAATGQSGLSLGEAYMDDYIDRLFGGTNTTAWNRT